MDRREFLKTVTQTAAVAAASSLIPRAAGAVPDRLSLVAVGDCILTRRISHRKDPGFLELLEILRSADCAWGNCETATLENLEHVGLVQAGSGEDLAAAARPAYYDSAAGRIGQVNCCSTFMHYFPAGPDHPHLSGRPGGDLLVDARGDAATSILQGLAKLSKPFGTEIEIADGVGRVRF